MNLINFKHREDFGHDWYIQILNTGKHFPKFIKNYSLFQFSVSWMSEPCFPYIQVSSGNGHLLSIMFWAHKFGFDIDVLSRTWNFDRLKELEDESETP